MKELGPPEWLVVTPAQVTSWTPLHVTNALRAAEARLALCYRIGLPRTPYALHVQRQVDMLRAELETR